jgi:protein-S-isoprenylcysteine O-methyltransferase Ste14
VWPYALIFWAVYLWSFWPEWRIVLAARKGVKRADSQDRGSIKFLLGLQSLGMAIGFPGAFVRDCAFTVNLRMPLFVAGLVLLIAGSQLRRYCFRALGKYFTGDVQAARDQRVIDTGPYRVVRHPSYTGGTMMFAGMGLALGSWCSFIALTIATAIAYGYRVMVEERALLDILGDRYAAYATTRKRFIPYII